MAAQLLGIHEGFAACDDMITVAISVAAMVQPDVMVTKELTLET